MARKAIRWAASVYGRDEPEMRPRVEKILKGIQEEWGRQSWFG